MLKQSSAEHHTQSVKEAVKTARCTKDIVGESKFFVFFAHPFELKLCLTPLGTKSTYCRLKAINNNVLSLADHGVWGRIWLNDTVHNFKLFCSTIWSKSTTLIDLQNE